MAKSEMEKGRLGDEEPAYKMTERTESRVTRRRSGDAPERRGIGEDEKQPEMAQLAAR